ncbi:MAG: hypothetical protein EAZ42_13050 [Verrucomicrobia bacterium]|nr:MAG: hypothetical protein EAZ42_13050 [Verrucomicrobiota bacterium]
MHLKQLAVPAIGVTLALGSMLQAASFTLIGDLPGGRINTIAKGCSGDGQVVIGFGEETNGTAAFVWTAAGGLAALPYASSANRDASANGISINGSRIVGNADNEFNEKQAVYWTRQPNGSYQITLMELGSAFYSPFETESSSFANAVSSDGMRIVGSGRAAPNPAQPTITASSFYGWIYPINSPASITLIPDLTGGRFTSFANGISGNGNLIVGQSSSANRPTGTGTNNEAIRFSMPSGPTQGIGDLRPDAANFDSKASAISRDGTTIIGRGRLATGGNPGFRFTDSLGMESLGNLPTGTTPINTEAIAVNGDGRVIVGLTSTSSGNEAFIWTINQGMRSLSSVAGLTALQLDGGRLEEATGVSDDGKTIVGTRVRPNPSNANSPFREAFVLTLTDQELGIPPTGGGPEVEAFFANAKLNITKIGGDVQLKFLTNPSLAISYHLTYSANLEAPFTTQVSFTPNGSGGLTRNVVQLGYLGAADASVGLPEIAERFPLSALPPRGFWRLKLVSPP